MFRKFGNKCIALARSEWLLHMDIDERVPPDLAQEILAAIGDPRHDAYRYRRSNYFLNRPMVGGAFRGWNKVQLARRELSRFTKKLHENLVVECAPARIGQLKGQMLHLTDDTFAERLEKSARYTQMEAERILEAGERVGIRQLLVKPITHAVRAYVLKEGLRDGMPGLIFAVLQFDAWFRAYALAWDRQNRHSRSVLEEELRRRWAQTDPSLMARDLASDHDDH